MSFDYRFEPPYLDELESMAYFECPYNHECDGCEYDCEEDDHHDKSNF